MDFLNSYVLEGQEIELLDEEENYACNVNEMICDIDDISAEYKKGAVEYWRSSKLKPRTIESVKSRIRKVMSVDQLRRWEKQMNVGGSAMD